jgi:hypothetical protein
MTRSRPPTTSYEVALAGSIGPAYRAALATAGTHGCLTTSRFLLPASSAKDLGDVVAMLQAHGLMVLNVRRMPGPSSDVEEVGDALTSSPVGDAPGDLGAERSRHSAAPDEGTAMTTADVHGPVDFLLLEFPDDRLTGRAAEELLTLIDRGIVDVYDVVVVGKDKSGATYGVDLAQVAAEQLGGFADLAWARSGLLTDEDMEQAAVAMQPGTLAALIVYENTWARPFVAAARESGGELIAGARLPAQDVMNAIEALESLDSVGNLTGTRS